MPFHEQSRPHPPEPGHRRNRTQIISLIVGFALVILGLSGLQFPAFAGLHLSALHSTIIASVGALLFYYGYWKDNGLYSYWGCLLAGVFFGIHAIMGFIFGKPGIPQVGHERFDDNLIKIIPNFQELGTLDHILNAMVSVILLAGAIDWKRRYRRKRHPRPTTSSRPQRRTHSQKLAHNR